MEQAITVKGIGKISSRPDRIVLSMQVRAESPGYEATLDLAAMQQESLRKAAADCGVDKNNLKTEHFGIHTRYDLVGDGNGRDTSVFTGYECCQVMTLQFPMDMKLLADLLAALSVSEAKPVYRIRFTVSDSDKIKADLLRDAAQTARAQAAILAEALHVTLGEILSVEYSRGVINLYSHTEPEWGFADRQCASAGHFVDIEPEDIQASDTVTFVWGIRQGTNDPEPQESILQRKSLR